MAQIAERARTSASFSRRRRHLRRQLCRRRAHCALLYVSGQICFDTDGKLAAKGQLGGSVSVEDGQKAARACAVNLLAQVKAALGDLDKVVRVVRLGGFINATPGFVDGPKVMNGASDLMVAVFGDKGRHARTTVGVAALPVDAAVEVEGLFEVA
jgi:enamine deaminase RidA (YjgF/YER057c/UK114 family)